MRGFFVRGFFFRLLTRCKGRAHFRYDCAMDIAFQDGEVAFGVVGQVVLCFWRAPFTRMRLQKLKVLTQETSRRHGRAATLGIFDSSAINLGAISDAALRNDATDLAKSAVERGDGPMLTVIEGDGFGAAALRAAATTIGMALPKVAATRFSRDVPGAIDELVKALALDANARTELLLGVEKLRACTPPKVL